MDPGRPARTDKSAVLDDAIRVLNQLTAETGELKDAKKKLEEEIKTLKVGPIIIDDNLQMKWCILTCML